MNIQRRILYQRKKETRVKSNQTQLSELESTGTRGLLGPGSHKTQLSTQAKERSWNSPGRKASMQPPAISPTHSGKHEMSVWEQSWGLKEYLQNPAAGVVYYWLLLPAHAGHDREEWTLITLLGVSVTILCNSFSAYRIFSVTAKDSQKYFPRFQLRMSTIMLVRDAM